MFLSRKGYKDNLEQHYRRCAVTVKSPSKQERVGVLCYERREMCFVAGIMEKSYSVSARVDEDGGHVWIFW